MLFGARLVQEVHAPWKNEYVAYDKLKRLLKENVILDSNASWTEADETRFVSTLDEELEKVYGFHATKQTELTNKVADIEKSILACDVDLSTINLDKLQDDLDKILYETQELDRFNRLNFTGVVKIVKKHDRLHPKYHVSPLLQVRLNALPFHSEDYSPLLYRLSALFSFLQENFPTRAAADNGPSSTGSLPTIGAQNSKISSLSEQPAGFQSFKFWVHPENVMEVKTHILRHLPVLVYDRPGAQLTIDQSAGSDNLRGSDMGRPRTGDPILQSLYFDNSEFELYNDKLNKTEDAVALSLKWTGDLQENTEVTLERKLLGDSSRTRDLESGAIPLDLKLTLKPKYIQPFLEGSYAMEKTIAKMKERGASEAARQGLQKSVSDLQSFIKEKGVQPVLRTIYHRTAFQVPGDDTVRASLDSDIYFVREDAFDRDRPIRDPGNWRRLDLDSSTGLSAIRKSEICKFEYCVLELKVRIPASSGSNNNPQGISTAHVHRRHRRWIEELMSSHLVKEVPRFSKYVHGVASLYAEDDHLDNLPFWLPDLERDIRLDPKEAYKRQARRLQEREAASRRSQTLKEKSKSLSEAGGSSDAPPKDVGAQSYEASSSAQPANDLSESEADEPVTASKQRYQDRYKIPPRTDEIVPKLAVDSEDEEVELPPGVTKPKVLLRQSGPVKVETKVWLANERTFNRWLHLTSLLSALTFTLYHSISHAKNVRLAEFVAYSLFALTLFSGVWGYYVYLQRLKHIRNRSERHLDNVFGPLVVAVTLLAALIVNFVAKVNVEGHALILKH